MGKNNKRPKARCVECDSWVILGDHVELWDYIICPVCDTELQIISLTPLTLDYAAAEWDEEESQDDDREEDDYY